MLLLDLDGRDELGTPVKKQLIVEMLGRQSNVILVSADGHIIDCMRRVDSSMSETRQVQPGLFYRLPLRQVDAIIHRQSIVHSLVEYRDGAMLAQLGTPDMKLPIRYAMTYPYRAETPDRTLDLLSCPPLTFAAPDEETFRCLKLARQCAAVGGTACAILNGANEEAVGAFLQDAVGFNDIPALVEAALETVEQVSAPTLEEILAADHAARKAVRAHIQ